MKKIIAFLLLLTLFQVARAQVDIKGIILDKQTGQPVEGVLVQLKNGLISSLTNSSGSFEIRLYKPLDTLLIQHQSFLPVLFPVTAEQPGSLPPIMLQPKYNELNEVTVSTGLQLVARERATGSFDKIETARFNEQVSTNVLSRLEAISSSLAVNKKTNALSSSVSIRGLSSINGPRAPLIILDNFPYEGDINNINPNDVESITLLKDAAAASIWGTRAGNGVIVITTKKGKLNQALSISLNNNISYTASPDLFYDKKISSSDFIDVEQFLFAEGFYNSRISDPSRPVLSPVVELLEQKANGTLTPAQADAAINALRLNDTRTDFNKYMYQTAVSRQHAITLSGGTNSHSWNASGGVDDNTSNLGAGYNRVTLKTDQRIILSNKLQLSAGLFYTSTKSTAGRPGYQEINPSSGELPPYVMFASGAGEPIPVMRTYRQPYLDTAGGGRLLNWNYYPLTDYKNSSNTSRSHDILGTVGLQYKIIRGLDANIAYQYQHTAGTGRLLQNTRSFAARDIVNGFSSIDPVSGAVSYVIPKGGILNNSSSTAKTYNIRGQLNYSQRFNRHELNAIAGYDIRQVKSESEAFTVYGYNDNILTYIPVDFSRQYPHYITGNNTTINDGTGFTNKTNRFLSFYTNGAYTVNSKYTASFSVRRDASNLFGVTTNNKWTPLWSAGAAWNISRERFYKIPWLEFLKTRLTYGISGNADPSRSAYTTIQYLGSNAYTFQPIARLDQFANPSLQWEEVAMLNIGVDFKAFKNRVSGSIEHYRKKATNLIGVAEVDYTGVATYTLDKNTAQMKGSGWDIIINSQNTSGKLSWQTNLLWSINTDKITEYYLPSKDGYLFVGDGNSINASIGRPVYSLYSYRWGGLDASNGDPVGYLADTLSKNYSALTGTGTQINDLVYHGRALPKFFGSLGNTISYKGMSLTARITYKFGYYFRKPGLRYTNLFNNARAPANFAERWQEPGDERLTNVPSMTYPASNNRDNFYANSEVLVEKGDHIRLQYITLSYRLPNRLLPQNIIKGINLYINANNIGILWRANKAGIDPDYRPNTILPGRNIAVGASLNF
ncbi:MAG: SusC/RagA family TonB-linked outer membrane protein [Rhizobacter sp.]|nr:SusC/RagA family TonB-linked outer membrane protein [Ferruginibacter sp.]